MVEELAIETTSLSKTFGEVQALRGLDLAVPRHSIYGFLGPNGAGKTTTMKLLLGLIRPTGGTGTILGHGIVKESLAIRARIGYLPQQPHFIGSMTARETLRFTAHFFFSGPSAGIERRVDEMLHMVGLTEKADRPIKGFSGGERQRLGMAQAQIGDPELLILDEPAAALDPIGRRDVLAVMEQLRERTTIFYSTHILDDVQQVSDTVAILNHGELVAQGPIERLLNGGGRTVFTVTMEGKTGNAYARVTSIPWVSGVSELHRNGTTTWQVEVRDEQVAKEHLLRQILSEPSVVVTKFVRRTFELEEVFMALVESPVLGA